MILNRVFILMLSFSVFSVAHACHSQYHEMKAARRSLEDIQIQVMVHKYSMKNREHLSNISAPAPQSTLVRAVVQQPQVKK